MQIQEALKKPTDRLRLKILNPEREVEVLEGETLLQCARRAGVDLTAACAGQGVCGGCLIRIISGSTIPAEAGERSGVGGERPRACRVRPVTDMVVELSPKDSVSAPRTEIAEPDDPACPFDPVVPLVPGKRVLGLSIDLGTTNLAGSLTDLESGKRLARRGMANPQAAYGLDVISRINYAIRSPGGGAELRSAVVRAIQTMAQALCEEVSAAPAEIADIALCGNTAMHHLMLGLPVRQLGRAPFIPASCTAMDMKALDIGLEVMPGANVHFLPNIGGFVGGDHVATLLATQRHWLNRTCLVIDIGTNTELSLIHDGAIVTASAASGPALEGGNISCGMRAAEGAIEKVRLIDGEIVTQVIGGVRPVGMCGSGVLEAVSALRRAGIINHRGYLHPGRPDVREIAGVREFCFTDEVTITQNDVRAVLLAKAAIRAATDLLLREMGRSEIDLEEIVIAGAFGAYIDIASAIGIGLLPALPRERFTQVGNAAGAGVRKALVSAMMRDEAVRLARRCRHVELNGLPGFQKAFIGRIAI